MCEARSCRCVNFSVYEGHVASKATPSSSAMMSLSVVVLARTWPSCEVTHSSLSLAEECANRILTKVVPHYFAAQPAQIHCFTGLQNVN